MKFMDDWNKQDTQKQAGVQRASLPSAQKTTLKPPLLLTKEGVAMADGKGGMKLITPSAKQQTAPIVKPKAAQSAGRQLVNTGTMISDTGSSKRQAPAVTVPKSRAQQTVDNLPNIQAFGAGDYTGAGKLLERAAKTVKAGALSTAGSFAELAGQATPVTGEQHLGQFSGLGDLGRAVRENRETGEDINAITQRMETERRNRRAQQRQATFDSATRLFEKSAQAQAEAKEGAGTVGQFLVDMGVTGTQMLGDAVANLALPGSGLAMMGMRSYGQAANEARQQGKSEEQQFLAGLKSAGIETFTEKMFGAFSKIYGKAGADELVEKLVTKLTKNRTGQALLTWIVNGAGEGVEEVTSDVLNPLADRLLRLDNGGDLFTTEDVAQMGYDFLLGTAMGLVGGAGQLGRGMKQRRAQTAENAYYDDLRRNGLFSGTGAANARRASDAMGRAMPAEYARIPQLVDANGMDAQQRTAWLGALEQMPQAQRNQFETAAQIAKRFGATVQARTMREGVQGSYRDGIISIDPSATDPVRQVMIHELTHHMERSGLYGKFSDAAVRFVAEDMGADVDTLRRAVMDDYARAGVTLDEDGATREIVAKFAEEKLFTDEATVRRLLVQDRNLFQRIYDWLRDTVAKLQGTQEQRRLIDAQNLYEKALRQAEAGTQGRGTQYDINPFHRSNIDQWRTDGMPGGEVFNLGSTGPVLQGVGAAESDIYIQSDKVNTILREHPEMTLEEIKRLPEILEDPILILKSKGGGKSGKTSRVILFGSVKAQNGQPVMAVMDLRPYENGLLVADMQKVNSAYTKKNLASFIESSEVLHADEKRVIPLLRLAGLTMTSQQLLQNGSIGSISYNGTNVNISGIPFSAVTETAGEATQLADIEGNNPFNAALDVQKKKVISAPSFSAARRSEVFAPKPSANSILISGGNVNTERFSTGRSIEEMAGVDTGRTVQENGLYRRDTGDAAPEDAVPWQALYGGSDRMAPPEVTTEPVSAQDAAEQNSYMEQLARDENIIGDDPYTVSDAVYDAQLRRLERQEAPPERTVEQTTQADLDDLVRLYADQADPIGSREDRIRAAESMVTDHTVPERKSTGEKAREAWSYLYRKMVDAGHSVNKVSEAVNDPYLYQFYNQARASTSAGVSMIADAQTDVNAQKVGESLNAIFSPIRQKGEDYYHEFQMYLFNLHNIDRMSLSQNKERAMLEARAALREFDTDHPEIRTDTEAQLRRLAEDPDPDTAALARQRMQLLRAVDRADAIKDKPVFGVDVTADVSRERVRRALQAHPEFEGYRQQVRRYIDNLMQYRVDSGLMTQENADFLKEFYPNYVPTMRVTDGNAGAGRDRNAVRVGRTVGRAQGGAEQLVPLHEALGKQTMKVVREGSKNRFGQRMLDDYVSAGDSPAVHRYIKDAQEFDGSDFDPDTLNDVSSQPIAKDKTFTVFRDGKLWELTVDDTLFDALKALSPDAVESNTLTKVIRASNNLFKSLVTGYNPTFLVRNTVRDLQTAGLYTRDGKAFLRNYPRALAQIKNNGEYWQMYKALGGSYSSVFDYATGTVKEPTSKAGKLMARLESLNMATEQAPRLAEFMSVLEKGGVNSETLADALYAAADVTVNFGRAGTLGKVLNANYVPFLNPGIQGFDKMIRRVTETKGGREWAKLIGRAAVLGIAPTLINSLLYHDDEEWDDLRDSDKDTNYMFKLKDGIWLKIPKGRELSLLGITADRVSDAVQGRDVDLIATLNTMGNQVAPANPLTSNIASALVDSALLDPDSPGRTWYGGDIENQRLQSYAPGQRYDSSTDVFSKAVGGALGISPKKLNYVLDQYTGVVGDFLLPILTPQAERGMFAKAFTTDAVTSNRVSGDFFDEADELTYAKNGGDETAAVVSRFWSKQQSACSDLWKEIREVEASDLSDKEKRQKTRELKAVVTGIQKNALAVEESYRTAAEKYLQQGMEAKDAYRAANKECFGAEYALQTYNKDVYERAKSAKANGVSYDDFYTYYFGTKDIKSTAEKSAATQKFEWLQSSGLDLTAQAEIYFADMASDTTLEQQAELESGAGITPEQFYQYKVISSGLTGRTEKLYAIHMLDLTDYQKDALYYMNGWSKKTHEKAPWVQGVSTEAAANRLAMAVVDRESQPEEEPEWKQSLAGFLGTGTGSGGNPFLRKTADNPFLRASDSGSTAASENPFVRAMQKREAAQTEQAAQSNPFVRAMQRRETTQTAQTENPFVRAMQKREAAQTNPFLRGQG